MTQEIEDCFSAKKKAGAVFGTSLQPIRHRVASRPGLQAFAAYS